MENSPLGKISTEICLQIYAHVFQGTKITTQITDEDSLSSISKLFDDGDDDDEFPKYQFGPDCGLAITCRAIRIESSETMWRNVFVKAVKLGPYGEIAASLKSLNKVLPDEVAQHITHLANIRLPEPPLLEGENANEATTYLLKYLSLKVCTADYLRPYEMDYELTIGGVGGSEYVKRITDDPSYGRQLVPFEVEDDLSRHMRPSLFLEKEFGIYSDCGIQIIGRSLLQRYNGFSGGIGACGFLHSFAVCTVPRSKMIRNRSNRTDCEAKI